jgi:transposase
MFLKMVKTKSNTYVQLVRSYREGEKTKHELLCSLGTLEDLQQNKTFVQLAKRLLSLSEHTTLYPEPVSASSANQSKESTESNELEGTPMNWGYLVYETLWKQLELDSILHQIVSQSKIQFDLSGSCFLMCLEHLLAPKSKAGTYENQNRYLHFEPLELHHLYRTLDALPAQKETLEQHLFQMNQGLFNQKVDVVFFDATTFSFASTVADDLRQFGYSKDGKGGDVQVVFGLLMDKEGRPIGYELFPGSTFDGHTLVPFLDALKSRFAIDQIILVADRGLNSGENLQSIKDHGYDYIVGTRLRSASDAIQRQVFQEEGYIENDISTSHQNSMNEPEEVEEWDETQDSCSLETERVTDSEIAVPTSSDPDQASDQDSTPAFKYKILPYLHEIKKNNKVLSSIPGQLIITWSKKRAGKDAKDRENFVAIAQKYIENPSKMNAVMKKGGRQFLTSAEAFETTLQQEIETESGKKEKETKAKKRKTQQWLLNEEKIQEDATWDGYYAIETSRESMKPEEILGAYHQLWKIEDCFRMMKSHLEVRPVFHWKPKRIEGHFVICFLSFVLERTLEYILKQNDIHASPKKIREALNSLQYAAFPVRKQNCYLKMKGNDLSKQIVRILKIKSPEKVLTEEDLLRFKA